MLRNVTVFDRCHCLWIYRSSYNFTRYVSWTFVLHGLMLPPFSSIVLGRTQRLQWPREIFEFSNIYIYTRFVNHVNTNIKVKLITRFAFNSETISCCNCTIFLHGVGRMSETLYHSLAGGWFGTDSKLSIITTLPFLFYKRLAKDYVWIDDIVKFLSFVTHLIVSSYR